MGCSGHRATGRRLAQDSISVRRGNAPPVLSFCCFFSHFFPAQPAQRVPENRGMLRQPSACPLVMVPWLWGHKIQRTGHGAGALPVCSCPNAAVPGAGHPPWDAKQQKKKTKTHKPDISQHPSTPPPRIRAFPHSSQLHAGFLSQHDLKHRPSAWPGCCNTKTVPKASTPPIRGVSIIHGTWTGPSKHHKQTNRSGTLLHAPSVPRGARADPTGGLQQRGEFLSSLPPSLPSPSSLFAAMLLPGKGEQRAGVPADLLSTGTAVSFPDTAEAILQHRTPASTEGRDGKGARGALGTARRAR